MPALVRTEPLLVVLTLGAAAVYATFGLLRHAHFGSSHDLALFDQAVWHYSRFELPATTLVNVTPGLSAHLPSVLGDHFHPILALLAPLYWVWSDVRMLLLAQAGLVAASVVPVFLFARLQVGRVPAYLLSLGYLLYWGIHTAVAFDFHEVAFAPLLIALAVYFSAVSRWRACAVSLALLLLVKEDMGVLVAFFGVYCIALQRLRFGLACIAAGFAWLVVTTEVVIPYFAERPEYRYWRYTALGPDLLHALWTIVRDPTLPFIVATDHVEKVQTLFFLFAPFLGLALYSPLVILAVPLIGERMLADAPVLWGMSIHYSLTISPVIAMAAAQGLRNLLSYFRVRRTNLVAVAVAAIIVVANIPKTHVYVLDYLRDPSFYRRTESERLAAAAIEHVPRDIAASVAAKSALAPHVSQRQTIYELHDDTPLTDYIVYQWRGPSVTTGEDAVLAGEARLVARRAGEYETVYENERFRVLRRRAR